MARVGRQETAVPLQRDAVYWDGIRQIDSCYREVQPCVLTAEDRSEGPAYAFGCAIDRWKDGHPVVRRY